MFFDFNKEKFEQEIIDKENSFRLMYSPTLDIYIMACTVYWAIRYERYYLISKEEYKLYTDDKNAFYQKLEKEINQKRDCFTERLIGSAALRDYDGLSGFQNSFPPAIGYINPFQCYVYVDGILYARIVWENTEIYVPPIQMFSHGKGEKMQIPLREKCDYQIDTNGRTICYKLKPEYYVNSIPSNSAGDALWIR